jgi:hypothetical protein
MRRSAILAPLGLVVLLAGCGGGSSAPAANTTTPPVTSTSGAPTGNAPADPAAAKTAITHTWETFFSSSTPSSVAAGLLENGDSLGPALKKAKQEDKATGGNRSARVKKITFSSPTQATVNYHLKVGTITLNSAGAAVLQDGTWKVSQTTFCTLVELGNNQKHVASCPG